jgi:hypothetical protein
LQSIVNYGVATIPPIDSVFGPTQAGEYWSVTPLYVGAGIAWYVDFIYGYVNALDMRSNLLYVRAVRGGS